MLGWASQQFEKLSQTVAPPPTDASSKFVYAVQRGDEQGAIACVQEGGMDVARAKLNPTRGSYAIHLACQQSMDHLIRYLLQQPGVDLTYIDSAGNTPLHYACMSTDMVRALPTIKMLVQEFSASVVAKNSLGQTPYDVASVNSVRQYLLPLQLQQETQAAIDNGGVGLPPGIDMGGLRIKNPAGPPPPTGMPAMAPAPMSSPVPYHQGTNGGAPQQQQQQQHQPTAPTSGGYALSASGGAHSAQMKGFRKPDGFHSSSSDVSLQKKYGHYQTQYANVAPPPASGGGPAPVMTAFANGANPFASGGSANPYASGRANSRYVAYDAVSNTTSSPMPRSAPPTAGVANFGLPNNSAAVPNVAVFQPGGTPAPAAAAAASTFNPATPQQQQQQPAAMETPQQQQPAANMATPQQQQPAAAATATMSSVFATPQKELPATATTPAPSDALPPGWKELTDPASGRPYYYNETDNTTSWEKPAPVATTAPAAVTPEPAAAPTSSDELPPGWKQATDPSSGSVYYYNELNGQTSWDKPVAEPTVAAAAVASAPAAAEQVPAAEPTPAQEEKPAEETQGQEEHKEVVTDAATGPAQEIAKEEETKESSEKPVEEEKPAVEKSTDPEPTAETTETTPAPEATTPATTAETVATTSEATPDAVAPTTEATAGDGAAAAAAETVPAATTAGGEPAAATPVVQDVAPQQQQQQPPEPAGLPEGWHEVTDPASGKVYYYHVDGRTSWDRPAAPAAQEMPQPVTTEPAADQNVTPVKTDPPIDAFSPSTTAAAAMAFGTPAPTTGQDQPPPQEVITNDATPAALSPLAVSQPSTTPAASNIFAAPPSGNDNNNHQPIIPGGSAFGGAAPAVSATDLFSSPMVPTQAAISNEMRASTEPAQNNGAGLFGSPPGAVSAIPEAPRSGAADLFASPLATAATPSSTIPEAPRSGAADLFGAPPSATNTTITGNTTGPVPTEPQQDSNQAASTFAPTMDAAPAGGHISPIPNPNQAAQPASASDLFSAPSATGAAPTAGHVSPIPNQMAPLASASELFSAPSADSVPGATQEVKPPSAADLFGAQGAVPTQEAKPASASALFSAPVANNVAPAPVQEVKPPSAADLFATQAAPPTQEAKPASASALFSAPVANNVAPAPVQEVKPASAADLFATPSPTAGTANSAPAAAFAAPPTAPGASPGVNAFSMPAPSEPAPAMNPFAGAAPSAAVNTFAAPAMGGPPNPVAVADQGAPKESVMSEPPAPVTPLAASQGNAAQLFSATTPTAATEAPPTNATPKAADDGSECGSDEMLDDVPLSPNKPQQAVNVAPSIAPPPQLAAFPPPPTNLAATTPAAPPATPGADSLFAAIGMPPPPFSSKKS